MPGELPADSQPTPPSRQLDSADILKGEAEVLIEHGTERYRLRLTRNGKLILQK